jgi:hypothetical protein
MNFNIVVKNVTYLLPIWESPASILVQATG